MRRHIIIALLTILCLSASLSTSAQKKVREFNRSGNSYFKKGDYSTAEIEYRKALELNSEDAVAKYNLANVLYHTNRTQEAGSLYNDAIKNVGKFSPEQQADLAHNAGNVFMKDKEYEKAIECYKASLRRRPSDEETRYNLALAQKLLEKEKQDGGGGGNDSPQDNQDKDQQDQNKDQNQDRQKEQPQDQPPQPQNEDQMSRENAEKILKALLQDEKQIQQKVEQQKQQTQSRSRQKNW